MVADTQEVRDRGLPIADYWNQSREPKQGVTPTLVSAVEVLSCFAEVGTSRDQLAIWTLQAEPVQLAQRLLAFLAAARTLETSGGLAAY